MMIIMTIPYDGGSGGDGTDGDGDGGGDSDDDGDDGAGCDDEDDDGDGGSGDDRDDDADVFAHQLRDAQHLRPQFSTFGIVKLGDSLGIEVLSAFQEGPQPCLLPLSGVRVKRRPAPLLGHDQSGITQW